MKTKVIVIALAGSLTLGAFNATALHEVSASVQISAAVDFHVPLATHGVWIDVDSYGRCWYPSGISVGWRPYSYGHWVWTDCGWYWVSDEPWAWACYHYGRWVYHPRHAWIWVPGVEWGPAWVSWRVGGGFVGWAPLPPRADFRGGVILAAHVDLAPERFVFVESQRFHERFTPRTLIVNNHTVIQKTTHITNIKREDKAISGSSSQRVVVNEGPGLGVVPKGKMRTESITEVVRQTPAPAAVMRKEKPAGPSAPRVNDRKPERPAETRRETVDPRPRENITPPPAKGVPPTGRKSPPRVPDQPPPGKAAPDKGPPDKDINPASPDKPPGGPEQPRGGPRPGGKGRGKDRGPK
ncbi:MAG: DUF6600 domain-containing protein [Verrucomicrobiota bacterium]